MRNCPMNESTHCSFDIFTNSWDLAIQTDREIGNSSKCIVAKLATPF